MLHDIQKQIVFKQQSNETLMSNVCLSQQNQNPNPSEQNGSTQMVSNFSDDPQIPAESSTVPPIQLDSLLGNQDSRHLIDLNKLKNIQQHEKQIEKVAQQLIILKDIIRQIKISIGIKLQDQLSTGTAVQQSRIYQDIFSSDENNLQSALRKLQCIQDKKITPEYKEWILQYFTKILNDLKQIKQQFENYQRAKQKSQNQLELSESKMVVMDNRDYESLIEFQVKAKLLQNILKLCKAKGIFTSSQYYKQAQFLSKESLNCQTLQQNLKKYKLTNIGQKISQLKKSSPEEMFYQWKKIHDQLQIINIQQIQRFYKERKQLCYINNTYQNNENGILIIGGSGVGKTTLFLSMAGQKMIKKKIKSKSCQYQNYQAADQQIAQLYKTSPFSTSCTRQPAKLQAPKKYTYPEELCLIDTAGFEDSRSGQIDVMNTLYTYETIQQMKKLRIVVVVSEKSIGQREQGLKKMAKNIARYFRDYEEVRESILFVLTKFDNVKRLKVACDNILKSSGNQKQTNQYQFIKHLHESIIYKQVVEFRPTDQKIVFDAQYHIDSVQMDGKLKKLYKALIKKFPIHHQYQNDYINLEYSKQTREKLIQKKCYLENMIRKMYKEGNNNFRYYLEQLMFLENKINKLLPTSRGSGTRDTQRYIHGEKRQTFDILLFIDEINQQVLTKFEKLLQIYLQSADESTLSQVLTLKQRYSNLYLGDVDMMVENSEIVEEDYNYIFQQIAESINSLKAEFDRIVEEKYKVISKTLKFKPKWCHDIKNKNWLVAVLTFTRSYFANRDVSQGKEIEPGNKSNKVIRKLSMESQNGGQQTKRLLKDQTSSQFRELVRTLKKNQQKFKQQFIDQINIMDQQISNYLIKKTHQTNLSTDFLIQTQKEICESFDNFKKLVFYNQLLIQKNQLNQNIENQFNTKQNYQNNQYNQHNESKLNNAPDIKNNPYRNRTLLSIPTDQYIHQSNLQYIIKILTENLNKEFNEIQQNIDLMNMVNYSVKDTDMSRNVFLEVERYSEKVKLYYRCDKEICQVMEGFYQRVMTKVKKIIQSVNSNLIQIISLQSQNSVSNSEFKHLVKGKQPPISSPAQPSSHNSRLQQQILYSYLSKMNQVQQFCQLRRQMQFQVRCFNLKLGDYCLNLQKQLQAYDEQLGMNRKKLKKLKYSPQASSVFNSQLYLGIRRLVPECVKIQHQVKLIHHYLRSQDGVVFDSKYEHLLFVRSIGYRHTRFLDSEKKAITMAYNQRFSLKNTVKSSNKSNPIQSLPLQLLIDYLIVQQIYNCKLELDESRQFQKIHNSYQNTYLTCTQYNTEFEDIKTHELKMLNQTKRSLISKLIEYPFELAQEEIVKIDSIEFQNTFYPQPIRKTFQLFCYYTQLRNIFEELDSLNHEELGPDFQAIELNDVASPLQLIEEKIQILTNTILVIIQIANCRYDQIKESLSQVVLDEKIQEQTFFYLQGFELLRELSARLQKLPILTNLEDPLDSIEKKSLFEEIKQLADKSESIFYRISKNIDSIELQHLENISQILDKPQSTKEFLKLLKAQCLYFIEILDDFSHNGMAEECSQCFKELVKKMEESETQIDFQWEEQVKQLEKTSKDPKNSLHKLIKLYQHHISKVSTHKTLEYRFVQLKKQQLTGQIKEFLKESDDGKKLDVKKVETGKALCEQLKNYLNFLKSMKFKMVVNLNGIQEIKNIEGMERLYQKETTRSQAQKSQTDLTPSQARENLFNFDNLDSMKEDSQCFSIHDVKTSYFGVGQTSRPLERKSAMRRSQLWDDKKEKSHASKQSPRHPFYHDQSLKNIYDQPFNNIIDDWSKQSAMKGSARKKTITPPQNLIKSKSNIQFNITQQIMASSTPVPEKPELDNLKKYSMTNGMKKSGINMKLSPPTNQNELMDTQPTEQNNYSTIRSSQPVLNTSESNRSLQVNPNKISRLSSKHKTQQRIDY